MAKVLYTLPAANVLTVTPVAADVSVYRMGAANTGGFLSGATTYGPFNAAYDYLIDGEATYSVAAYDAALGATDAESAAAIATAVALLKSAGVTFSAATAGIVLKRGSNGLCGTFTANGATPVTVNNTNIAITDAIVISLNTVGGTVSVSPPAIQTITAATGFTVQALALDTSIYNYAIIKNAA